MTADISGAIRWVVHDSTIVSFAGSLHKDAGDVAQFTQTMADLLAVAVYKTSVEAMGFVGIGALITDARAAVRDTPGCNDVFVTASGALEAPVLGWLTNTDLAGRE